MTSGIRAEMVITDPPSCQVAGASGDDGDVYSVSRGGTSGGTVTEEFTLDADDSTPEGMEVVFSDGSRSVYRFTREAEQGCACELVEEHGIPIRDARVLDGRLRLTFYAPDIETLQSVVERLKESCNGVSIRRLTRSEGDTDDSDLVFLDRSTLTDRQREVLATAHEMGYFDNPKGANAGEVAEELGIATATFAEHLAAAQSKLLDAVLDA